jgi:hypothetical protein
MISLNQSIVLSRVSQTPPNTNLAQFSTSAGSYSLTSSESLATITFGVLGVMMTMATIVLTYLQLQLMRTMSGRNGEPEVQDVELNGDDGLRVSEPGELFLVQLRPTQLQGGTDVSVRATSLRNLQSAQLWRVSFCCSLVRLPKRLTGEADFPRVT